MRRERLRLGWALSVEHIFTKAKKTKEDDRKKAKRVATRTVQQELRREKKRVDKKPSAPTREEDEGKVSRSLQPPG